MSTQKHILESVVDSHRPDILPVAVKIFGYGKVIRGFLESNPAECLAMEIFNQQTSAFATIHHQDIVVYACSIDEKKFLESQKYLVKRKELFHQNVSIVNEFLYCGYFRQGRIFVLSNPSELLAEHIRLKSGNPSVYALGLSHDADRYRLVLQALNKYQGQKLFIGGNHYDESCLVDELNEPSFKPESLHASFLAQVASEFIGKQPPIHSGVKVLQHLWEALSKKGSFFVSGYSAYFGCMSGGTYCFNSDEFCETLGNTLLEKKLIARIAHNHKKNMKDLGLE